MEPAKLMDSPTTDALDGQQDIEKSAPTIPLPKDVTLSHREFELSGARLAGALFLFVTTAFDEFHRLIDAVYCLA